MNIRFPTLRRGLALVAALVAALPAVALAHPGRATEPHDAWRAWSAEPGVVALLVAGTWVYLRGARRMRGRAVRRRRVWWLAGSAVVALALLSPIDAVGASLFAVHMVQHLLLIMVAAPLLALGEPLLPALWALPLSARRGLGRWWRGARAARALWHALTHPVVAWTLHVAAVIFWHVPRWYDAAARRGAVHALEHASFMLTALLFWWVLTDRRSRHRLGTGPAVLYLFAAALASTLLGAAITLARHPWYTAHWGKTGAWGLTALEDQQLAGLIMWVPAGLIYLIALAPILVPLLRAKRVTRRGS